MSQEALNNLLRDKQIIIWGARIVGRGFARYCDFNNLPVKFFVDSDPSLHNRTVNSKAIKSPNQLIKVLENVDTSNITIVICVSIKEAEIIHQIKSSSLPEDLDIICYSKYSNVFYTIDIVGCCNLRCASCAHSIENHQVPVNIMKFDILEQVVQKIKRDTPLCTHVALYSWGEPLLHPRSSEIIKLFHENHIAVSLSTNLSHRSFEIIEKPLKQNPEYLKISLSGYYPQAYNSTHQGGDITLVKSNLYKLRYILDKFNLTTSVDINYHLYKNNNGTNLSEMRRLAQELDFGLSTVNALVMPLERVLAHCDGSPDTQTIDLSENLLVTIDEGIKASSQGRLPDGTCPFRENQLNINSDLTVPVCCTVFDRDNIVINNFLNSTIEAINEKKSQAHICKKCTSLGLPEYNMGFNRPGWDKFANEKVSTDIGLTGL